ncbi:MAG: Flp pilus assembly complex ATPase component TadA [Verrucomicrobia bacterium]|nr:Flp pilus assembly complex ATPase component TadA [Verrucomicrobiota bacterium]
MSGTNDYLLDLLVDMGYVTGDTVAPLQEEAATSGEGVVDLLVARGYLDPSAVLQAKASYFNVELVSLADLRLSDEALAAVPRHIAKRYRAVPVSQYGTALRIAISDPSDLDTMDALQRSVSGDLEWCIAPDEEIDAALNKYYGAADDSVGKMIQDITEGEVDIGTIGTIDSDDGTTVDADAPIIKLVNQIIVDAFKMRASDIHLEPLEKTFRIRYRIDGVLHEVKGPPKKLQPSMISRLKIQSNMSIAERRVPQDGRIKAQVGGKDIDLRVSCLPTNHGESIVMRILDKEGLKLGLPELGFLADDQQTFERMIGLPDGILLVTGPTGSGKTTTLYSCLNFINRPDRKIITVEDPVEYLLAGINQVQVSELVGLTFAAALRSMLRQAPNVIMLGEIRDMETAGIAINASLTGHLVFSTLHTNDAPGAVTRLIDIGVKPFLVASSARCLMAQRLVRKICKHCGERYEPTETELTALNIDPAAAANANFKKGKGCGSCSGGYRGRFGVFEIFIIEDEARKLIYEKVPSSVLRIRAREMGMRTLREDGARKVLAGLTTPEEVIRATVGDAD